MVSPVSGQL
ncbi:hypothetical protein RDI58_000062 [Solanum bulbocastanum]|uniref:Uncharacterized protein n=1 Tax=Solanum bulbocastanum TaxID=147425 RepID=A0AAN8U0Z0_SOLBU